MTYLDAGQARREFSGTLQRVSLGKERIVLRSEGHNVAVLVPSRTSRCWNAKRIHRT